MARDEFVKSAYCCLLGASVSVDAGTKNDHVVLVKADSHLKKLLAVDDPKLFHNLNATNTKKKSSSWQCWDAHRDEFIIIIFRLDLTEKKIIGLLKCRYQVFVGNLILLLLDAKYHLSIVIYTNHYYLAAGTNRRRFMFVLSCYWYWYFSWAQILVPPLVTRP